jgi:hypothetical protein
MERHEIKSRVDAKLGAWKRDLDAMRVRVDTSEGDEQAAYYEQVAALQRQHEELTIKVAQAWEAADEAQRDSVAADLEKELDDWSENAAPVRERLL